MKNYTLKILLICLILLLLLISLKEHYPARLYNRLFQHKENIKHTYADNLKYHETVDLFKVYDSINQPIEIVLLGNSLTQRMDWGSLLNGYHVANMGIPGDITAGYLPRLPLIEKLHPTFCLIEGGLNDVLFDIAPDSTIRNLESITDSLKTHHIIPVLTTITFIGPAYDSNVFFNETIKRLNSKIEKLSTKKKIDLIPLNHLLFPLGIVDTGMLSKDGIHLKFKAYLIWKKAVKKIIGDYQDDKA